jgi:hypothetical protein
MGSGNSELHNCSPFPGIRELLQPTRHNVYVLLDANGGSQKAIITIQ